MTTTRTTCPYCGVGCGVLATPQPDGTVAIAGDPDHPANFGRLCSKGAALGETLALDGRLTQPLISGAPASWDDALQRIADTFAQTIATHGPDSVALYVSGQFLTEDYYVANKLMKGFIGTANIDTNSRLCMSSSVAGHRRAFGSDTVPGSYTDLEDADLVVLVGSNLAWCHPVLFQRLAAARERNGTKVVVIDPRRTATSEIADLHLSLAPDSDVDLFAGLLAHLGRTGTLDRAYIDRHTNGLTEALAAIGGLAPAEVAEACGLSLRDVDRFFELFATTEKVVTVYSQGVNQSVRGSDKVNAIINCHLATGRIGRPGMGPLSATGQPNAMGGREVGGLANMLAAHMDLDNPEHRERVQRFWASPTIADKPGLKAIDLFRAVADGTVKAIWIMATNPVVSMPEADLVKAALKACPFVVVSDVTHTDTTALAHVLLPAAAWGEKSGTVTNSERRISRQRAFLDLPGEARPDWWALAQVARRMGFAGFDYAGPADIYREHAALSTFENEGNRDFDIGADAAIGTAGYDALAPFQWPAPAGQPKGETRFFAQGGFYTPDRKARFVATPPGVPKTDMAKTGDTDGLILNTGRIRDHWHTMTRTGKTARLMAHIGEPFCEIAPQDADRLGIAPADLVQVSNDRGAVILRALVTPRQREGSVFVPIHWNDQFAARARVGILVDPATDPVSGQPGSKNSRVTVARHAPAWHGFLISADRPNLDGLPYWAIARSDAGWRAELAGDSETEGWEALARRRIPAPASADSVAYHDAPAGVHRIALVAGDRLVGALFISPQPVAVAREVIASRLGTQMAGRDRLALLAGRAGANRPDPGATVCACFAVGINQILGAVRTGEATSVEAIGACLKAGTNCGSCRSEIGRLIQSELPQAAE